MKRLPLFLLLLFFFSCGNNHSPAPAGPVDSAVTVRTDSAHIFILPAPMQISTLLIRYFPRPETGLLSDDSVPPSAYETDYSRGLNLGICITDIGYAAMYDERNTLLHYLGRVETLAKDLRLDKSSAPLLKRMRDNIGNCDSLSRILLGLYDQSQQQLQSDGNNRLALFISSGAYLESLVLTTSHSGLRSTPVFPGILAQEKTWTDNFLDAVSYLPPDEDVQDLYNSFYTLQHYFLPATIDHSGKIPAAAMPDADFEVLKKKAVQLRDEAVRG